MSSLIYKLHTKGNGTLVANYATDNLNSLTRGDTTRFNFWFPKEGQNLVVSGTYTIAQGSTEVYDTVTVESTGTLNVDGELFTTVLDDNGGTINKSSTGEIFINNLLDDGFATARQYADWAGKFASLEMLDGTEKYREQIPSNADVSSIVLGIEPSEDLQSEDVTGIWGIVTNGTDPRNPSLNTEEYQLEVQVLAEYDEYADHAALESALSV